MTNAQRRIVEILTYETGKGITTGEKRNILMNRAYGTYIWFIDDDDEILPGSMGDIIKGCLSGSDVVAINGYMTTNGANKTNFEIRIGNPYCLERRKGGDIYLRFPNHITPIKREKAIQVPFPKKNVHEDYEWAEEIRNRGLLKTQYVINKDVYHYRFIDNK